MLKPGLPGHVRREGCCHPYEPRIASLKALEARNRTTVLALTLIASPVCGLRPMRALRCALTARPRFGITNFPAPPLHSFTASLNSSSKNVATVFFGVLVFSAKWATTFDLLNGFAILIDSPLRDYKKPTDNVHETPLAGNAPGGFLH